MQRLKHETLGVMLIALGGLPGSGKTTLARALATKLGAVHVRIDTIEQVLAQAHGDKLDDVGYRIGYEVARDNLRLGRVVVADSVNPIEVTRAAWREVADSAGVPCVELEVHCSDRAEHQLRVDSRDADIPGHVLPRWQDVLDREWEPWMPGMRIDTAARSIDSCADELIRELTR